MNVVTPTWDAEVDAGDGALLRAVRLARHAGAVVAEQEENDALAVITEAGLRVLPRPPGGAGGGLNVSPDSSNRGGLCVKSSR